MKSKTQLSRYFCYLFAYNLIFLCTQLIYILAKGGSFINALSLPASVHIELITTLTVHVILYFLLTLFQLFLLWGVCSTNILTQFATTTRRKRSHDWGPINLDFWHIIIWCMTILAILSINAYFYPLSAFSKLLFPELPNSLVLVLLWVFITPVIALLVSSLISVIQCHVASSLISISCAILFGVYYYWEAPSDIEKQHAQKPNIIIIGIDSLCPKSINSSLMPNTVHFLSTAILFKNTISPLAHTYPAWSSILTGLYPHHHHASYNLMPKELVQHQHSIVWSAKNAGYATLFATDDRRFNNLDREFGFLTIIGPKAGVNDMLIGTFNDFPLSNLIINFPISKWLFPYNYLNRASHYAYYPSTFDTELQRTIKQLNHTTPLFLAVHFTLPHWPYAWASTSPQLVKDEYDYLDRDELYKTALHGVDKQVNHLLATLKQQGLLKNSLIILLSDHGETLYAAGSRHTNAASYQAKGSSLFVDYLKRKTSTTLENSVGHGTDLLSPDQYHALLAFKIYKNNQLVTTSNVRGGTVALIDIAPTIMDYLSFQQVTTVDGISLYPYLISSTRTLPKRTFYLESGMLPNQFLTREKAKQLGQQFFTINPTNNQLVLKKSQLPTLDAMKLYGVIQDDWVLALYPDDNGYIPIIQNLSNGKWVDNLSSNFAYNSPAKQLLQKLEKFYQRSWPLEEMGDKVQSQMIVKH